MLPNTCPFDDERTLHHCPHLREGDITRHVVKTAVGRYDNSVCVEDLFSAAGADVIQIDEPYMQARPAKAKQYGIQVLNRALDGATGTTAVHICFGYAAIIHERPSGYSFLPEL